MERTLEPHKQQLGRYELLRCIARGGMGEIYLAEARGAGGFQKKVVIKRILPYLASEPEFVQKFIDEANIVTHLTHGNIVPVFDMGEEEGELYIAMEYIPGRDLREVLQVCRESDYALPVPVAMFLVAEVCKGLAYAHRKTNAQGQPLDIIHRDISPSNILISDEGEVKIVDFGIAKATSRMSKSITGRLQGKFRYMSPEQAMGREVDARSDIFSTGVVLYELLTLQRPFESERDLETLELVRSHEPPRPSVLRPEIPAEVDAIVMKALAKDPRERFAQVDELEKAILTWLYSERGGLTSAEVAAELGRVFPEGLERPEVRHSSLAAAPRLSLDDAMAAELDRMLQGGDARTPSRPAPRGGVDPLLETATGSLTPVGGPPSGPAAPEGTVSMVVDRTSSPSWEAQAPRVRIGDPGLDEGQAERLGRSTTIPVPAVTSSPTGEALGQGLTPATGLTPAAGLTPATGVTPAAGLTPAGGLVAPTQPVRARTRWAWVVAALLLLLVLGWGARQLFFAPAELLVTVSPSDAQIWINGEAQEAGSPLRLKGLKPGLYLVEARKEGFAHAVREQPVTRGEVMAVRLVLQEEPEPLQTRGVWLRSTPPGASVMLNGQKVQGVTPLQVEVPLAGGFLTLIDAQDSSRQKVFALRQGEAWGPLEHNFQAAEAPDAGLADLGEVADAQEAQVDAAQPPEEQGGGEQRAELRSLRISSSPPGAVVSINGARRGVAPLTVELPRAYHRVTLSHPGYEEVALRINPWKQRALHQSLKPAVQAQPDPPDAGQPEEEQQPEAAPVRVTFVIFLVDGEDRKPIPVDLTIDGKQHSPDKSSFTLPLAPGTHRASARGKGSLSHYRASKTFALKAGDKEERVFLNLQAQEP